MIPVVFINCSSVPFLDDILAGKKTIETRTRDTLRTVSAMGRRVYLAETGHGRPVIRASAVIGSGRPVDRSDFDCVRIRTCIPVGSRYDWQPGTKVKYCYQLYDVRPVEPFTPPEGVRHGRVWMEYTPAEEV